jgi:hypothetical protein
MRMAVMSEKTRWCSDMPSRSIAALADLVELVDTQSSGGCAARRPGSSPGIGTTSVVNSPLFTLI